MYYDVLQKFNTFYRSHPNERHCPFHAQVIMLMQVQH
jgi:hypothetical protein